jgi:hypothetical protein
MNNTSTINTVLVLLIALAVGGAGYYVTGVQQPGAVERIEETKKLARLKKVEVEQLLVEEAGSRELAEQSLRKWRARYKYIPTRMETPDIVQYLESLTQSGFEGFNISLDGITAKSDFKYYTFSVNGTAYYQSLYDFVWKIENNREFYRVRDLSMTATNVFKRNDETGVDRRLDMVKFSMKLDAYFEGVEGLSASREELMPVPDGLLPGRSPAHNSFYPVVRTDLPPNDRQLVDVESAKLVSILGNQAVLEDSRGQHVLGVGDEVYLGQITVVDPFNVLVRAVLNKGGVSQNVELKLDSGESFRRAEGRIRLNPIEP